MSRADFRRIGAGLQRVSDDGSWLTDLSFVHQVLAPGDYNFIRFENVPQNATTWSGFWGTVNLSSLTIRATSVPEPASFVLFGLGGLGIVGSALARRTKLAARSP